MSIVTLQDFVPGTYSLQTSTQRALSTRTSCSKVTVGRSCPAVITTGNDRNAAIRQDFNAPPATIRMPPQYLISVPQHGKRGMPTKEDNWSESANAFYRDQCLHCRGSPADG